MNIKTIISMTAAALLMAGFAPSEAAADSKHKKHYKKYHKKNNYSYKHKSHHHNHGHKHYKKYHSHGNWHRTVKYKYDRPDYDRSSFSIYGTPGGGIGFSYSEFEGNPYPYYSPYF